MFRYNTLRIESEVPLEGASYFVQAEVIMVDSKHKTLDREVIKCLLLHHPKLNKYDVEEVARFLSLKLARYAFKEYPYTLTVKVKVSFSEDGSSSEMELSQDELIIEQHNGGENGINTD